MKIGIVCPYDWSVPGGVQAHIYDLALELMDRGHTVSVLAPTSSDEVLPDWVVSGGDSIAISYNGSVARLAFGFRATQKVRKWIRNGHFDVLHVHEPLSPSLSALACWAAVGPVVGTFHSSMDRSRILSAGYGLAQTALEKITARIAVSELARNTIVEHVGGDAVLIPNGVHIKNFENVEPFNGVRNPQQIAFLGRLEEPRKGFSILLEAFVQLAPEFPELSLVVAGPGDGEQATKDVPESIKSRIEFLGRVSDLDKARMLRSSGVYVAPNTGGESFGIVLLEAMACRTPVIASDLPAFMRVLDYGQCGLLFANESVDELVIALRNFLQNPDIAQGLAQSGFQRVQEFDWSRVASQILDVYATVVDGSGPVQEDLRGQIVGRLAPDTQ